MDDILKRMLAVEQEADKIVSDSSAEAAKIMEAARQKANEIAAEAQAALAVEVENYLAAKQKTAETEKNAKLAEADQAMEKDLAVFQAKVDKHLEAVTSALLFPAR